MAKPFAFEELVARLRAVTRRGRTRQLETVLSFGPVELDPRVRTVTVGGAPVLTSHTEFRLLEVLMMRAEQIVSRDELCQRVWDRDSNGFECHRRVRQLPEEEARPRRRDGSHGPPRRLRPHQGMRAAVSPAREPPSDELASFAAAVAHDLRTPLAALSGEVDVALRRDRSADAYREALTRIAGSVAELVELTGDLSLLGEPGDDDRASTTTARLDAILAPVRERYASNADVVFAVTPAAAAAATVTGDEALLARAVTILVQYALAHRRTTAGLVIRAAVSGGSRGEGACIDVIVDAAAGTFWPHTWRGLGQTPAAGDPAAGPCPAPLRLRTADRIVTRCGGSLHAASADGAGGVHIRLRCAEPM